MFLFNFNRHFKDICLDYWRTFLNFSIAIFALIQYRPFTLLDAPSVFELIVLRTVHARKTSPRTGFKKMQNCVISNFAFEATVKHIFFFNWTLETRLKKYGWFGLAMLIRWSGITCGLMRLSHTWLKSGVSGSLDQFSNIIFLFRDSKYPHNIENRLGIISNQRLADEKFHHLPVANQGVPLPKNFVGKFMTIEKGSEDGIAKLLAHWYRNTLLK